MTIVLGQSKRLFEDGTGFVDIFKIAGMLEPATEEQTNVAEQLP
jgi:hypothetical protein